MASRHTMPGVTLITGAASGIGRAIAHSFLLNGCTRLALLDINPAGLEETKAELLATQQATHLEIECIHCDVTDPASVNTAYTKAHTVFTRIDYAVHCAGIIIWSGPSHLTSIEDFDRQNGVNYRGLFLCSREALRIMSSQSLDIEAYPSFSTGSPARAQRGAIVNISSALAMVAQRNCPIYNAAKAAILGLTRSDAMDYVHAKIRVNAVCPGIVDTPITSTTPEVRAMLEAGPVQKSPMKRFGLAEEIGDAVVFLASTRASLMTGASVPVDGGQTAGDPSAV